MLFTFLRFSLRTEILTNLILEKIKMKASFATSPSLYSAAAHSLADTLGTAILREQIFTVGNSSCGKVMFSQACIKNSVHRGDMSSGSGGCTPPRQTPTPQEDTPPGRHPAPGRHPLQADTPHRQTPPPSRQRHPPRRPPQRTVRILLECILLFNNIHAVKRPYHIL